MLVDNYFESDLKDIDKSNLVNLTNQIYTTKIKISLDKGQKLFEENNFNEAAIRFEEALKTSEEMFDTEEKKLEIERINSIASGVLNPIYLERVNPILNKGKELVIKESFEENVSTLNEALDLFEKSLEITNTMADSKEKSEKLNEITSLINKTCKTRINYIKELSIQKIGQGDYEKAIDINLDLGKEIKVIIDDIKKSIEKLQKGLLEKFNNK
ncbi:unnamed protein product [marine sediment metagenome]|uniref:Uncharacterized protein n=1 Tax=marine sediment metagenome TaxID=412755 RepID=X1B6D7_9ZZZZ